MAGNEEGEPEEPTGAFEATRDRWPVVVVGAGAAGLLGAIFAARGGVRTLLLETRLAPGAKIRVSGGGRCNVLPSEVSLDDYETSGSRNALRNILFSWPLAAVRGFFERELSIPLKVEPNGKVFPASDRAQDVVKALLDEAARSGVTLRGGRRVEAIERVGGLAVDAGTLPPLGAGPQATGEPAKPAAGERGRGRFRIVTGAGETLLAERVILATGGLSLPRTGSDGGGLRLASQLGHSVVPTRPALVPLLAADLAWRELSGISLRARIAVERAVDGARRRLEEREGDFLFTHRGFSGPVVLDVSHWVTGDLERTKGVTLRVAWQGSAAPDWEALLRTGGPRSAAAVVRGRLPRRLADRLFLLAGVPCDRPLATLRREERERLVELLTRMPLETRGDEGYATAEVTAGGVPLDEVDSRTLESRRAPGLHLCGELLDVTGRIGGYNFLWAWVTGKRAGEATRPGLRDASRV